MGCVPQPPVPTVDLPGIRAKLSQLEAAYAALGVLIVALRAIIGG